MAAKSTFWVLTAAGMDAQFYNPFMAPHYSKVLLMWLTLAGPAAAQTNWPWFRGANADGISKGEATATVWNAEKLENILWKKAIPGLGHSSPII